MTFFDSDMVAIIILLLGCFLLFSRPIKLTISSGTSGINSYVKKSDRSNISVEMSSGHQNSFGTVLIFVGLGMLAFFDFGDAVYALNL